MCDKLHRTNNDILSQSWTITGLSLGKIDVFSKHRIPVVFISNWQQVHERINRFVIP